MFVNARRAHLHGRTVMQPPPADTHTPRQHQAIEGAAKIEGTAGGGRFDQPRRHHVAVRLSISVRAEAGCL